MAVQSTLRRAVLDLRTRHRTLRFPAELHIAQSATAPLRWTGVDGVSTVGSRTNPHLLGGGIEVDVMRALLRQPHGSPPVASETWLWLSRPGAPAWHDLDTKWLAAASLAHEEVGVGFTMTVVTKQGWYDPRSGCSRRWKRLRSR